MPCRPSSALVFVAMSSVLACSSSSDAPSPWDEPSPSRDAGAPSSSEADAEGPSVAGIETPDETSGSRLKPYYRRYTGSDGSVLLTHLGWYDAARHETCELQKLSDGHLRCAPWAEEPAMPRETYFQDASCAAPVIGFSVYTPRDGVDCASGDPPRTKRYVRVGPRPASNACVGTRLAAFPSSPRLALTTVYRRSPAGACEAYSLAGLTYEIYASPTPLEEIDPAEFVDVTTTDETPVTSERLRRSRMRWSGADGSSSLSYARIVDTQRDEFCTYQTDRNGQHRCMPVGEYLGSTGFSDPQCRHPAWGVTSSTNCSGDPRDKLAAYMQQPLPDTCGRVELYPRFATAPLSRYYYGTPTMCSAYDSPADGSSGEYLFDAPLPSPVDPAAFSLLERSVVGVPPNVYGTSGSRLRLRAIAYKTGAFSVAYTPELFDTVVGDFCSPTTLEDGRSYCVGGYDWLDYDTQSSPVYADAACTDPIVGTSASARECGLANGLPPRRFLADRPFEANGCRTVRLYEPPAARAPIATIYQRAANGACQAVTVNGTYDFYHLRDMKRVAPSRFVEAKVDGMHP